MRYTDKYYDCIVIYDDRGIIRENEYREISINNLKYNSFELIEEQQDIDIQAIEEKEWYGSQEIGDILPKLVKAVKQLDLKIKENI